MKDESDILAEAIAQLKEQSERDTPPPELLARTSRQLADAERKRGEARGGGRPLQARVVRLGLGLSAAAAILIATAYAGAQLSAPRAPDLDQLRRELIPSVAAALEPTIREKLADEMTQRFQLALANTYVLLREELTAQYREELNRYAAHTLVASNNATNQLLAELAQSIRESQTQQLYSVAQALEAVDSKRRYDTTQLTAGLQTLAYQTNDLVQLLSYPQPAEDWSFPTERQATTPHEE
jgi:hypothetical protein